MLAKADLRELHSRMSLLIQEDEEKHGCLHYCEDKVQESRTYERKVS